MGVRQIVLLTPPKSSHPSQLLSRQHHAPHKSLSCNTYGFPRKCCKQTTYGRAKSFSCNTYKKQGGGGPAPFRSAVWIPDEFAGRSHKPPNYSLFLSYTYKCPLSPLTSFHILTNAPGVGVLFVSQRSNVSTFKRATLLFATHPKNAPITHLFATHPNSLDLNSFPCHTYEKRWGWGALFLSRAPSCSGWG